MLKAWWEDIKRIPYLDTNWVVIWISIYASFILLDMFFPGWIGTNLIKYTGILLCVIYAHAKYPNDLRLIFALLFTLIADTLLVWTSYTVVGVYVFCIAQLLHLLRLTKARIEVIFTWIAAVSLVLAFAVVQGLMPLIAIASVYAVLLISNLVTATTRFHENKTSFRARCAFYGFIAFICCDICVAINSLAPYGAFPMAVIPTTSFLIWFFYYPSQVFLANSSTMPPAHKLVKSLRK